MNDSFLPRTFVCCSLLSRKDGCNRGIKRSIPISIIKKGRVVGVCAFFSIDEQGLSVLDYIYLFSCVSSSPWFQPVYLQDAFVIHLPLFSLQLCGSLLRKGAHLLIRSCLGYRRNAVSPGTIPRLIHPLPLAVRKLAPRLARLAVKIAPLETQIMQGVRGVRKPLIGQPSGNRVSFDARRSEVYLKSVAQGPEGVKGEIKGVLGVGKVGAGGELSGKGGEVCPACLFLG